MKERKPKTCQISKKIAALLLITSIFYTGCDNLDTKTAERHSQKIIEDLSKVTEVNEPLNPIPDIYLAEPAVIEGKDGVNLFYFTRFHTVEKYSGLIKEQFGFTVSQNPATNQLIIKCPTVEDAQKVLQFLNHVDVPPIQIKIDCLVSEVYADRTLDWETTLQVTNLFGESGTMGGSARALGTDVAELIKDNLILPAFPGASMREVARNRMGLKIGYAGENFLAMVDILESRGYLKVLMNPSLEVVNGRKAKISSTESVPVPKEVSQPGQVILPYTTTDYKDVVDSLEITPHAFADGSIGLETKVMISSKNIPEGVKQIPILTKREVDIEENRIRPGESLVIGGLRKTMDHAVVRGVPILKDIPLIGVLFSSKDYEEQAKEVLFIITPTISSGGIPNKQMIRRLKEEDRLPNTPYQFKNSDETSPKTEGTDESEELKSLTNPQSNPQ
jgi:type II secretory pathway component GspD/PulD (secretin)